MECNIHEYVCVQNVIRYCIHVRHELILHVYFVCRIAISLPADLVSEVRHMLI
jgi:hypothetical protein